jgi:hypothetical protein
MFPCGMAFGVPSEARDLLVPSDPESTFPTAFGTTGLFLTEGMFHA